MTTEDIKRILNLPDNVIPNKALKEQLVTHYWEDVGYTVVATVTGKSINRVKYYEEAIQYYEQLLNGTGQGN